MVRKTFPHKYASKLHGFLFTLRSQTPQNGMPCQFKAYKKKHAILSHDCVDHYILLLKHLSNHMYFIPNSFKRFSQINSPDPRQRVPLTGRVFTRCSLLIQTVLAFLFVNTFIFKCFQINALSLFGYSILKYKTDEQTMHMTSFQWSKGGCSLANPVFGSWCPARTNLCVFIVQSPIYL